LNSKVSQSESLRIARIGVFAALYVATSSVPISMFIGAPSFLALNLVITPAIAILLSPLEAFSASLIGAFVSLYVAPFQAMFGPFTILLPVVGSTLGSTAYHKPKAGIIVSGYLVSVTLSYIIARPEFPYWIMPHIVAASVAAVLSIANLPIKKMRVPAYAFMSTICEQATMLIGATFILSLPWIVFATAFPLMIYERIIATFGGSIIAYALIRNLPKYFTKPTSNDVPEVSC
jgi:hypothetical protein